MIQDPLALTALITGATGLAFWLHGRQQQPDPFLRQAPRPGGRRRAAAH